MFENIGTEGIIVLGLIVLAIILWINYAIIEAATKSKSVLKLHRMQVELLKELALKSGVDEEKVNEIIEKHNN